MNPIRSLLFPALLAFGCAGLPPAEAEGPQAEAASATADLERAFWACDYVATTRGVQATPVAACRHATESLKREKFGGSFPAMLEWWRLNKVARHREIERRLD